jgi:hypothetical protein
MFIQGFKATLWGDVPDLSPTSFSGLLQGREGAPPDPNLAAWHGLGKADARE